MIELTLYTRADCGLCREMEELIEAEGRGFEVRVERILIDGDAALEAQFGREAPVLFINGRKAFKYRATTRELRKRLTHETR